MVSPYTGGPTSSVAGTGDVRIDALLEGEKWGGAAGQGVALSFSFPALGSTWAASYGYGEPGGANYRGLNGGEQGWFRLALQQWSDVADIRFTEVADTAANVGDIRVAFTTLPTNVYAWGYYPHTSAEGGDIWLNIIYDWTLQQGAYSFNTLIHEIGHALGLKHPFEQGVRLPPERESRQYTVMSYTAHPGIDVEPVTPMLYDILAIQHLYGANSATRAGDTQYVYAPGPLRSETIWDGGGLDEIDASQQQAACSIDLRAGSFSSIGLLSSGARARDNIAIAFNVVIENARGGAGADSITGNQADNVLLGNAGNDTIAGGLGSDTVDGGDGNDTVVLSAIGGRADLNAGRHAAGDVVHVLRNVENVIGSAAAEEVIGDELANRLEGLVGNDSLFGNGGDDTLLGGPGDDLINGGQGLDVMEGGPGNDTVGYAFSSDDGHIDLSAGRATIGGIVETVLGFENAVGSRGANLITGTAIANRLSGEAGNDTLLGVGGGDTLLGGAGSDSLVGASGNDKLDGGVGNDTLDGGTGDDTLDGGAGIDTAILAPIGGRADLVAGLHSDGVTGDRLIDIENVIGSILAEEIIGDGKANRFDGRAGDDSLFGGDGDDTLLGGDGDDLLNGGPGADSLNGGAGNDTVGYSGLADAGSIDLSAGEAVIGGRLDRLLGIENVVGSGGDNVIVGTAVGNRLDGAAGDDTLNGLGGSDTLLGSAGDDSLAGGSGNDDLHGGIGTDTLDGGAGADTMQGGLGNDLYRVDSAGDRVIELPGGGSDRLDSSVSYALPAEVEDLVLLAGAQNGTGNDLHNRITGSALANVLAGAGGNDTLSGGAGGDTLRGGGGSDSLLGGTDDDSLLGETGNDTAVGGSGMDWMSGGDGDDSLAGGTGNDSLLGGAGDDRLDGGDGDDMLDGGTGNDRLFGGDGADIYRIMTLTDGTPDIDTLVGYDHASGDVIDLPSARNSVLSEAWNGSLWMLTLAGDGDQIRLEGAVNGGNLASILDDLLFI